MNELYQDRELYTSQDMFSPPSERLSHVIRFELTSGCTWGGCTYCNGYDGITAKEKSDKEYREHVNKIFEKIGWRGEMAESLRRIFIGGGNALSVEQSKLENAIDFTVSKFESYTGEYPSRVSLYGRTDDINLKESYQISNLFTNTSGLIYWGVESGSDKVLDYVNKGYLQEDIIRAARKIRNSSARTSVMIMPGLGGIKYYNEHIKETAKVLCEIEPSFLTFMGINPSQNSVYAVRMKEEQERGENRPLTDLEKAKQMIEIMARTSMAGTKVGCFDEKIDSVGHNPIAFGSLQITDQYDEIELVQKLRKKLKWKYPD